jgi:5'-deoxynucleotidase YfbR-like HD superfamily hydrolase
MSKSEVASLVEDLLDLYKVLLLPFMKVRRDMPFPTEPERDETDGEHAFTLGMVAITIVERLNLKLDTGLIAKYALVHDLVEAHAGDISVRDMHDDKVNKIKRDKEHEAYLVIKNNFKSEAAWIPKLIEQYEARQYEEAKFVYAVDKTMGALVRMAGDGIRWASYYPEPDGTSYHAVVKRLRQKAKAYPPILDLFDEFHDELDRRRLEYHKRET